MAVTGIKTAADVEAAKSASTSTASSDSKTLFNNMETFLTLLVTQLQNQDPTNPTDTSEFTNQLVMYAQAEQQIKTNSYLETLIELTGDSAGAAAVNYIGKEIQMVSNQLNLEDGKASFAYNIAGTAANCTATITDTSGNIVGYIDCDTTGKVLNQVVWDGKDSKGNQLPDGNYIVNVNAKSSSNQALDVAVVTYGKVGNVAVDGDGCYLGVMGSFLDISDVIGIYSQEDYQKTLSDPVSVYL